MRKDSDKHREYMREYRRRRRAEAKAEGMCQLCFYRKPAIVKGKQQIYCQDCRVKHHEIQNRYMQRRRKAEKEAARVEG